MTERTRTATLLVNEIAMPTGEIVFVDDDFDHSGAISMSGNGYPQMTNPETGKSIPLHQFIMGTYGRGYEVLVDHINRNPLDNRRENLRLVTPHESNLNRKDRARKYSLPPGVYHHPNPNCHKFQARVTRHYKKHNLGTFDTVDAAARAVADFKKGYNGVT